MTQWNKCAKEINMTDKQKLEQLFSEQEYLVLAVTLDDGSPWPVPVRMRTGDGKVFEWDSHLLKGNCTAACYCGDGISEVG
jgi:hypothetical protein